MVLRSIDQAGFPQIALAASAALFPLMSLFIWLDSSRYRVYMPLFTAGKCIGIFSILVWSIIAGKVTIKAVIFGTAEVESFLLYSYLFSMIAILLIIRDENLRDESIRDKNILNEIVSDDKNLEVE
ncbi:MAG: hypothetical protein LBI04_04125 [Treponema sp.]|nr:hypothetical protein [Treponema sp.]